MTPDSPESRIGSLEREMSALKQQVRDVVDDVEKLEPVKVGIARIEEKVAQVEREIVGLREAIAEDRAAAKVRGEAMAKEIKSFREEQASQNRANKAQLIAGVLAILVALIAVAGSFFAAGGFQ